MAQSEPNLRDYWWIIRRRKWVVLTAPVLLGLATLVSGQLQAPPPVYRATAVARFERTFNVNTLLLRDVVAVSPVGDLETNAALVKSFPVLSRAAKKLGSLAPTVTLDQIHATPAHQATLQQLASTLEVSRTERTSLIEITATTGQPDSAARVANSVMEAFQENDVETRTHQIVEARRFIETQLSEVGRRLRESEERLRAFQEGSKVLLLQEEARLAIVRLTDHESERDRLERDIQGTQVELRQVDAGAADGAPGLGASAAEPQIPKLQATLSDLILEREALLLTLRPHHPQVRGLDARIDSVRRELGQAVTAYRVRQVKALTSRLQVLKARKAQLTGVIDGLNARTASLPAVALEAGRIEREVKVNERIFSLLKERLQEALIKEKEQTPEVMVVRPAIASRVPVNEPQATQRTLIGIVLGLVIGLVCAFIIEALDTSIGAIQDIETLLETPILGVIPHLDRKAVATEGEPEPPAPAAAPEPYDRFAFLPTIFAPRSSIAEAIRGLRTNLLLRLLDRDVKTLVVSSAAQAEGKTTIAINLAVALAQLGKRTLLVETDLRNPSIRHIFGIRREPGVTDVVLGAAGLEDASLNFADLMLGKPGMEHLLDSPGIDNFFLLPSGRRAPNPAELMSSRGFGALLAEARQRYDYVILDSAPVLSVADSAILASQVDGIVCVVRVGQVPRAALRRAKAMLDGTKTPLLGVCLNGVRADASPDFQELTYYKYREQPAPAEQKPAGRRWSGRLRSRGPRTVQAIRVGIALLALGLGVAIVSAAAAWRKPTPARVVEESAARPPAVPGPGGTPAAYTVELPVAGASGQAQIGQFATVEEGLRFGEQLVRDGVTPTFRLVSTSP